jgi:NADPH-dependent 2,4-dienoyl-CoA reductase/sulfur reductase-like enzyme
VDRFDLLIAGGGLGGVAAALAAARVGRRTLLVSAHDWLGGQLTTQGVPPDEHRWIEVLGATASYRALREAIRDHYRAH